MEAHLNALEVSQLSKQFGGVRAVKDVSFNVSAGEVLACVGPNGAGKTTLINIITGWQAPDGGEVRLNGVPVLRFTPESLAALGVARTFQKGRVFRTQNVIENLLLAARPQREETLTAALFFRGWWRRNQERESACAAEVLKELGIIHLGGRPAGRLSGGEQRLTELAAAAMRRPKVLVLDEPVANLSQAARRKVASFLMRQRAAGVACIIVEHDMAFVRQVADRVLVLDRGAVACVGDASDADTWKAVLKSYLFQPAPESRGPGVNGDRARGGEGLNPALNLPAAPRPQNGSQPKGDQRLDVVSGDDAAALPVDARPKAFTNKRGRPAGPDTIPAYEELTIQNLLVDYGRGAVLQDVNMGVRPGEIVAITGGNGAGKSTTIRAILGLTPYDGTIRLGTTLLTSLPPHAISRLGVAYVPQHRKVFPSLTVLENLLLASEFRGASKRSGLGRALEFFPELAERLHDPAGNLSGGQQQMVSFARALLASPRLLLLDEPSAGLADSVWQRLASVLAGLAAAGLPILLVEHRPSALSDVITRGYFMQDGRLTAQGTWEDITSQQNLQLNLHVPLIGVNHDR